MRLTRFRDAVTLDIQEVFMKCVQVLGFLLLVFSISMSISVAAADKKPSYENYKLTLEACSGNRDRIYNEYFSNMYGCRQKTMKASETALVLVDMWGNLGKPGGRTVKLLEEFRRHNVFVIHGHGDAVLDHPKYQQLRSEVMTFLGEDFCKGESGIGGANRRALYSYRTPRRYCKEKKPSNYLDKIADAVAPPLDREREYVVRYEDEMRYVLYKNKIKNLIYIGGALDECMLHRGYGINALVGVDEERMSLDIYVLKDLIDDLPPILPTSDEYKMDVLLESMSQKLVKISTSKTIRFEELN